MRGRAGTVLGAAAVAGYSALLIVSAATTPHADREALAAAPEIAAERFVEAWERSRLATFVTVGRFERRSEVTGAEITSEDYVAQRPPRRLHRQLGGVDGRNDDRLLVCPAPPPDSDPEPCRQGPSGGRSYEQDVAAEVDGLRSMVAGVDSLYSVAEGAEGCFELDLLRRDPRAPLGLAATFCFDEATGAPVRREVHHEGGIREVLEVHEVRGEVSDADLEP